MNRVLGLVPVVAALCIAVVGLSACADASQKQSESSSTAMEAVDVAESSASSSTLSEANEPPSASTVDDHESSGSGAPSAETPRSSLNLVEDYRPSLSHGDKSAAFQKYIVLHDTEGESDPASVIDYWDGNGNLVAAHFVVGKDGSIVQCVPLDEIAHHAGFGDAGHNVLFGVEDESRDDKLGTTPIGDWAPDYGMNSWSVGIEMVHVGGTGYYPEEQLAAVDALIAYIDAYYGFESQITDHKAWRTGNSDTSPEFADFLANYQDHRTHL